MSETPVPPPAPGPASSRPAPPAWLRPAVDYLGPLAFMVGFFLTGRNLVHATWWLVAGSFAALALSYAMERRIAPLPLIWGGAALVFGVLTLVFHDPTIVKMKTTFIDLALGVALLGGLALRRNVLKLLMGDALKLSEEGWRKLAFRYALFFLAMAALNEVVWRTQPDSVWVLFRMPGLLILALAFAATQVPMMLKEARTFETAAKLTELQE